MSAPSMSIGAGTPISAVTIPASSSTGADIDLSVAYEGHISISITFGTLGSGAGVTVNAFRRIGAGPTVSTVPDFFKPVAAQASQVVNVAMVMPIGRYHLVVVNGDTAQSITATVTYDTVSGIA